MDEAFIGVDVGTGSARAGIFDGRGRLLASARRPIAIWREAGEIVEQSSEDIWRATTAAIRQAVKDAALRPGAIVGISFDATCSLAV
ncbi:MAG TPA: FGGY family carbohydrate kinase, partial [Roseiarcus sp.]|nr:FGGY family carbohydrate kinase [Roseiarcus sp.]